jgi:hypothetical protein
MFLYVKVSKYGFAVMLGTQKYRMLFAYGILKYFILNIICYYSP